MPVLSYAEGCGDRRKRRGERYQRCYGIEVVLGNQGDIEQWMIEV